MFSNAYNVCFVTVMILYFFSGGPVLLFVVYCGDYAGKIDQYSNWPSQVGLLSESVKNNYSNVELKYTWGNPASGKYEIIKRSSLSGVI